MKYLIITLTACLLLGCKSEEKNDNQSPLQGSWILKQISYPFSHTQNHTITYEEGLSTLIRIYEGDSVMYQSTMTKTETGMIVNSIKKMSTTLIYKGGGKYIYFEEDHLRPLTVVNDTTITIQERGSQYIWHRCDEIARDWGADIKSITTSELQDDNETSYVFSAKERQLQTDNYHKLYIIITISLLSLLGFVKYISVQKEKRRLMLQLQQIKEVQQERPQVVKQAIQSVETAYFESDEYDALQRRIATGNRLKDEDWQEIESHIRRLYPGFSIQLRNLYAMSELEYQVCLLIKLRIAPKNIAPVLARDMSTISTVRSRLYGKVFGRKGGAKEWDNFIHSIGT